ncbi:MAG TPA: hypothetical protein VFU36_10410, partial [Jatrophihabitans sp.]|nr:hypothetical protein [Jatrophihabitans sp.]
AEISFERIPPRLGPDRRSRLPTVIAAGAAAVLVLGAIGLLIDKVASRTGKPTASAAASHTAALPPLPPNGTTPPPGTGRFFGPAISPPDHALAAPRVAHGPGRSIVVSFEGSGTCPQIATRVRLTGPQQLVVDSIRLPAQSNLYLCTADLSPHLTTLPLPPGADPGKPLDIKIDRYTIDLPPR